MNNSDKSNDPIALAFKAQDATIHPPAKQRAIDAALLAFRDKQATSTTNTSHDTPIDNVVTSNRALKKTTRTENKRVTTNQGIQQLKRLRFEHITKPVGEWIMKKQLIVGGGLTTACAIVVSVVLFAPDPAPLLTNEDLPKPSVSADTSSRQSLPTQAIKTDSSRSKSESDMALQTEKTFNTASTLQTDKTRLADSITSKSASSSIPTDELTKNRGKKAPQNPQVAEKNLTNGEKRAVKKEVMRVSEAKDNAAKIRMADRMLERPRSQAITNLATAQSMPMKKIGIQPPPDIPPPSTNEVLGNDEFTKVSINPVKLVSEDPISTFSSDVDTTSYSFTRRQLTQGFLPQKNAVRPEEMINYFNYNYPIPTSKQQPFQPTIAVMDSPWKNGNKLLHIGIKGYEVKTETAPKANLVFLLDVSGSMRAPDKLPLVKQSMELLLSQLKPDDTVAIVVYAGQSGTVLEPTLVKEKQKIIDAMNQLNAGGGTAGSEGIKRAYELAEAHFVKGGVNRIFLATDGDFNLGIRNHDELKGFVERKREKGIFLSVLGFGQGNYHDNLMQTLAQNGNGIAAYIDTLGEAQKILVEEASSALFPIAKDVKLQVEFNPATVKEYRLIGYETRALKREDFNNDAVDAGDIGSGHTVTAIYELTPTGAQSGLMEPKRYGNTPKTQADVNSETEYGFLKIRYKLPEQSKSNLIESPILIKTDALSSQLQQDIDFATAVVGFSQLLRGGKYMGQWSYDEAIALAHANKGEDFYGYRTELVQLIRKAKVAKAM